MNLQTPILIVDADERKCTNVINILCNADYELFHAGDFEEAMNLTAIRKPQLVIIAIRENTDFGVEVCRLIRTEKVYFGTVILQISPENMLTAEGSSHTPDCEPDAYLSEICKPRELVSIVKTLLRFQKAGVQEKLNQEKIGKYAEMVEISEHFLWTLAPNGEVEYINQSWIDYTGLGIEQIRESGWNDVLHPDDKERVFAEFQKNIEAGEPYQIEMSLREKNGEFRNFLSRVKPLKNDDGEILSWLGVTLDVHEFKQIQLERLELNKRLQASFDELEILFDVLPVGVAITKDKTCQKITSNRYLSEIFSTPKDSNISPSNEAVNEMMGWRFFRDGKELSADDLPIQRALNEARKLEEFEFDVEMPSKRITFMGSAAPLFDENGAVSGSVGAFLDITERKKAERERERLLLEAETAHAEAVTANKAKDEFLAVLSHELRTPLNAMYGWVRMLSGGQLDEKATKRAIEVIERNIQLQTKLIEDILDVSRIISGKIKLESRYFDFVSLINSIVESNRPTALMKGVDIKTSFNVETLQYKGDGERLQQVLVNLLNNAVKFTPGNGKISIALEKKRNSVEVSVIDNGIGINSVFLPEVFDRFKQADGTTTRKHGGLGLGLAIVKHLTELHGGTVSAHSDGENQGATFKITLPTESKTARETSDLAIHTSSPSMQIQNICVLLVEDDVDAREMLRAVLEAEGAVILNANTGVEALKKLNEETPDIIVSDIGMPEMDGLDFIKSVRSDEQLKNIPAIALTAYASVEYRERILKTGFDDCLAKPVDFEKLKNAMNRVISRGRI